MVTIFSSGLTLAMGMMFEANCLSSVATDVRRDPAIFNSLWNTRVCRQLPNARRFFVVDWMSKRENDRFQRTNNSNVVLLERRSETRWFCFVANEFLVEFFSLRFPQESAFSPANNRAEKWWGWCLGWELASNLEKLRLQMCLYLTSKTIHSPIRLYAHSVSVSRRMTRLSMHMHARCVAESRNLLRNPRLFLFCALFEWLKGLPVRNFDFTNEQNSQKTELLRCIRIFDLCKNYNSIWKNIVESRYFFFESKKFKIA